MAYTLMGSIRSPFVRICRMFMIHHDIPFEFRVLDILNSREDAIALSKETPINKMPVMVDGDQKIFDSRVILNHLIKKHNLRPLTIEEENIISSIYGALDAGVILFLMKRDGLDLEKSSNFVPRQRQRIPRNLEYVMPWARNLDPAKDWYYPSMALLSALYWLEKRVELIELSDYPELASFLERFQNAPGVKETNFD